MTQQLRAVRFQRAMAPYEAMDIAGFAPDRAADLVARGIAEFWPPVDASTTATPATGAPVATDDILTGMDRAALVAFAKEHLGTADEPPADVTDDALRAALREALNPEKLAAPKKSKR